MIALVLMVALLQTTSLTVQEISASDLLRITAARRKLSEAAKELQVVERQLRKKHGDTTCFEVVCVVNASCQQSEVRVSLEGRYALIRATTRNVCAGPED